MSIIGLISPRRWLRGAFGRSASYGDRARSYLATGFGPPELLIIIATMAGELGLAYFTSQSIEHVRATVVDNTRTEAAGKALAIRESLTRTLDQVETLHGLAGLVTKARQSGDADMEQAAFNEIGVRRARMSGTVSAIAGFTADGHLDWSNMDQTAHGTYSGDREYVRSIIDGHAVETIGAPVIGRASGLPIIPFFKGIYDAGDTLVGMTNISMNPDVFSHLGANAGIAGRDTVTIVRRDGVVLSRRSGVKPGGEIIPPAGEIMRSVLAHEETIGLRISAIDGVERIAVTYNIDGPGLILFVGLDLQERLDRLQPDLDTTRHQAWLMAVLIGLVGAGSLIALRWHYASVATADRTAMLQDRESLFRRIAEGSPDTIHLFDRDGKALYVSPGIRDLLGIEPETALNSGAPAFVRPGDLSLLSRIATPGRPPKTQYVVRLRRSDRRVVRVQVTVGRIGDTLPGPGVPAYISSSRDITGYWEAEASLRRATEDVDAVLQAAGGVLFRTTIDDFQHIIISFISDSVTAVTGFTPAEVAGTPNWLASRCDLEFHTALRKHAEQVRTEGRSTSEYRIHRKDGSPIWVEHFSRRMEDDRSASVGYLRDITRDRERDQLMASEAEMVALGEMTTGMAHELNQPLAAISMVAQNTKAALDDTEPGVAALNTKLDRILQQVSRAASIIDHMRSFGRKPDAAPAAISVPAVIEGAAAIVRGGLAHATIDLVVRIDPDIPPVSGYAVLLQQVVIDLIRNAGAAIETRVPPLPAAQRSIGVQAGVDVRGVFVLVSDRAGEVSETLLARLFDHAPGFVADGRSLYISHGLVVQMGGSLMVRNGDEGRVFEIRLPSAPPVPYQRPEISTFGDSAGPLVSY